MVEHSKVNKDLASQCIKRIELYRQIKENSMYDDFYHSHLDFFQSLIEDWDRQIEKNYAVIMQPLGHKYESGEYSPVYATICTNPHYSGNEGVMLTSGIYQATKFDLDSEDLPLMFELVKSSFPQREFEICIINKGMCGTLPQELWSDPITRGNFDKTGKVGDTIVKEV